MARIFKASPLNHMQLRLYDSEYVGLTAAGWNIVLEGINTSAHPYVPDATEPETSSFVCNEFADLFRSRCEEYFDCNGAGRVIDIPGKHSYSAILIWEAGKTADTTNAAIALVEPQTDQLVTIDPAKHYTGESGLVVFG